MPIKPKHRYIFILENKRERKDILKLIQPLIKKYPKR